MPSSLTEQEFKAVLPPKVKKSVNPSLIAGINKVLTTPGALDTLKENILGYTQVMQDGRFKLIQYLNAVHYVSYKLMGATNREAYIKTFPDKYKRFLKENVSEKDIAAYSSAYNKTKLVNLIFEQTLIPVHVLNAPMFQQALNVQAELMLNANSEMVRTTAANAILTHLKPPEAVKIELDVGERTSNVVQELRETTQKLVNAQKKTLESGQLSAKQIAELPIAKAEVVDD
jgi:hypothetical protein